MEEASAIHRESIVIDAHCDTLHMVRSGLPVSEGYAANEPYIRPGAVEGGLTAQFFAADLYLSMRLETPTVRGLAIIDLLHREVEAHPIQLLLATSAADIERAKGEGKLAAIAALEGGDFLGRDIGSLRMFYKLGVRCLTLVHFYRNLLGDSVSDMGSRGGLSDYGVAVVREMNRLGMLVDLAHLSPKGFFHVLEVSVQPVLDTHAGCMALASHVRNVTDDQLRALGQAGGVIGMGIVGPFIDDDKPTLARFLDQVDHAVEIAGIDHVGLGSDLNEGYGSVRGKEGHVEGLEDITKLPMITEGLLQRGYKREDIEKILGKNLLRVFRQVVG